MKRARQENVGLKNQGGKRSTKKEVVKHASQLLLYCVVCFV